MSEAIKKALRGDPYGWRSDMDWRPDQPQDTLAPGPAASGSDVLREKLAAALGYHPQSQTAHTLGKAADLGTLGLASSAYDGGRDLAETGNASSLAMALMPGAKGVGAAGKAAGKAAAEIPAEMQALMRGQVVPNTPKPMPSYAELEATLPKARKVGTPEEEAAKRAELDNQFKLLREQMKPKPPEPQGIRAFHGSPHDFDKFDLSKIGTGEGAQAYGHGLYFAESEGVAQSYKKKLSDVSLPNYDPANYAHVAERHLVQNNGDKAAAIADLMDTAKHYRESMPGIAKRYEKAASAIEKGEPLNGGFSGNGRMYEVNIKANPDQFLDLDNLGPMGKQTEYVRTRLEKLPFKVLDEGDVQSVANVKALREAGIPGIKYLDQGSRAQGEGSRNYVAFDDSIIEILRKYGLLPPLAGGAAAASQDQGGAQ